MDFQRNFGFFIGIGPIYSMLVSGSVDGADGLPVEPAPLSIGCAPPVVGAGGEAELGAMLVEGTGTFAGAEVSGCTVVSGLGGVSVGPLK